MKIFNITSNNRFMNQSSSKGNQIKWYLDDYFIKADTYGYESIAEIIGYLLCKNADLHCIVYKPCVIKEQTNVGVKEYIGCYSKNVLKSGENFKSFYRLLKDNYGISGIMQLFDDYYCEDLVNQIVSEISKMTNLSTMVLKNYVSNICKLDAIIVNEDRHLNNIALIEKNGVFKIAPIFDNGISLLSYLPESPFDYDFRELIKYKRSKPFFRDFDIQASYFKDFPKLKIHYKNLVTDLQKLKFDGMEIQLQRALNVLFYRLEQTRGILWYEI